MLLRHRSQLDGRMALPNDEAYKDYADAYEVEEGEEGEGEGEGDGEE